MKRIAIKETKGKDSYGFTPETYQEPALVDMIILEDKRVPTNPHWKKR